MKKEQIIEYIKEELLKNNPIMNCSDKSKQDDSIMISGGFKTATSALQQTFKFPRTHSIYLNKPNDKINIVIFPFRKNESVYKSALFQDITEPTYDYCPFAKDNFLHNFKNLSIDQKKELIQIVDLKLLIAHYKKIDWDDYLHLNNINRLNIINHYYDINIDYHSKNIQVFNVIKNNNKLKIISFNSDILSEKFNELQKEIFGSIRPERTLINGNMGKFKWYGKKYNEFLKIISLK